MTTTTAAYRAVFFDLDGTLCGRRRIEVRGLCASLFCEQGELS